MWLPLRGSRCWSCCPLSALNLPPQDSESCPSSSSTATKNTEQRHQRQLWPPPPTSSKEGWIGSRTHSLQRLQEEGEKKKSRGRASPYGKAWEFKKTRGRKNEVVGDVWRKEIVSNVKMSGVEIIYVFPVVCDSAQVDASD